MLNESCNQWVRDGHMLAQEPVESQMQRSYLTFEIANGRLCCSGCLWVIRNGALGRCRVKLLHTDAFQRITDEK